MRDEFREGDCVLHQSFSKPIRVIGVGSTIAVEFPNGVMRAFEPGELKKVALANSQPKVSVPESRHDRGPWFGRVVQLGYLLCFDLFDWAGVGGAGRSGTIGFSCNGLPDVRRWTARPPALPHVPDRDDILAIGRR
jgi:hypothetical protein